MSEDIKEIIKNIESDKYDNKKTEEFTKKYIADLSINWTEKLAEFVLEKIKKERKSKQFRFMVVK